MREKRGDFETTLRESEAKSERFTCGRKRTFPADVEVVVDLVDLLHVHRLGVWGAGSDKWFRLKALVSFSRTNFEAGCFQKPGSACTPPYLGLVLVHAETHVRGDRNAVLAAHG